EVSTRCGTDLQFAAIFGLFVRQADFQAPEEALRSLSRLRQLAASNGDARSLAGLHLAVARLECCRGHCVDAHRHLEIARTFAERTGSRALTCTLDVVAASLELLAGNIPRARILSEECFNRARTAGLQKYIVGSITSLGMVALYGG